MDGEAKRSNEAQKLAKKNERRMKEIQFQADEDQKNLSRAQENSERLNAKIKKMRTAVEEAVRRICIMLYLVRLINLCLPKRFMIMMYLALCTF